MEKFRIARKPVPIKKVETPKSREKPGDMQASTQGEKEKPSEKELPKTPKKTAAKYYESKFHEHID